MKYTIIYLLLFLIITFTMSCSKDDDPIEQAAINAKSVTDCEISLDPEPFVSVCVDGTDSALPNEIITFASTLYCKNFNPTATKFLWTIQSGSMEILNTEKTVDYPFAKSIATIKFNADYSGNGLIGVNVENDCGGGYVMHNVE